MSACEIPYPCVGSTSAKNTNYGEKHFFNHVENMEDEDSIEISGCKTASPDSCVLKSRDLNGFGSEGKSSKRHNASAEQNLGMKRRRGCNSVQKSQDLKQCGDKKSEEFVKEVDAAIVKVDEKFHRSWGSGIPRRHRFTDNLIPPWRDMMSSR